jgi:Sulfotransferase family
VRERIARKAKILGRELFLELNHQPSRSVLVLGSGRSGTTWLAEAIARQHRSRLLFEPFHPLLGSTHGELRLFSHPAGKDDTFERSVRRVLSGRVRTVHIDQVLCARLARSRVVKDVHAANLLPWFRASYPTLPVIFVVRHPIAASLSRLRSSSFYGLGDYLATPAGRADAEGSPVATWLPLYDRYRTDSEPLVRLVAEWCIENAYPLSCIDDAGVALAFYETVVLSPVDELARLGEHCRSALRSTAHAPLTVSEVRQPSAMDWFGTAAAARQSDDWTKLLSRWTDEVPRSTVERCLSVLSDFGLNRFYGDSPLPVKAPSAG